MLFQVWHWIANSWDEYNRVRDLKVYTGGVASFVYNGKRICISGQWKAEEIKEEK
jgi:hypothetical protein